MNAITENSVKSSLCLISWSISKIKLINVQRAKFKLVTDRFLQFLNQCYLTKDDLLFNHHLLQRS